MTRHRIICLLASVATLGPAAASAQAADCADAGLTPAAATVAQVEASTLCLINQQRAAAGLPAVTANPQLAQMAAGYGQELVSQQFFAHTSPAGQTLEDRLAAAHYSFDAAGENLAWGTGVLSTPAQIMDAWMHSDGHRANILDRDFREVGVAVVLGAPNGAPDGATYVTDFGTQTPAPKPVAFKPATAKRRSHARARHARARTAVVRARARTPRAQLVLVVRHHRHHHRAHR